MAARKINVTIKAPLKAGGTRQIRGFPLNFKTKDNRKRKFLVECKSEWSDRNKNGGRCNGRWMDESFICVRDFATGVIVRVFDRPHYSVDDARNVAKRKLANIKWDSLETAMAKYDVINK